MQIQIQHCESSDFISQARALKEFLSSHYPNADISLASAKTDSFEVVVNDVVAHSNIGAGPNVRVSGEKFPSHAALLAVVKQVNDAAPGYQPPSLKKGPEELKTYMTVTIQYCGGWGYQKHFDASKEIITARYPSVRVEPISDKGTTGNFEITLNDNLVWSKKQMNHGFFDDSPAKMQEAILFKALEAAGAVPAGGIVSLDMPDDGFGETQKGGGKNDMICAMCQTLGAIPAILGAWCAPGIILAIITGGAANIDISGDAAANITFIMIATICFLTWFYLARKSRTRDGTVWNKYGPLWLSILGGLMMLAEPLRFEWHNAGLIDMPASEMGWWGPVEGDPLNATGIFFRYVLYYFGMVLLMTGSLWSGNIIKKLSEVKAKYIELRMKQQYA